MTQEDRFEEFVRTALSDLDPLSEVPRDEMWARIDSARRFRRGHEGKPRTQWIAWGIGLAAMLLVGIGLGRLSLSRQPAGGVPQIAQGSPNAENAGTEQRVVNEKDVVNGLGAAPEGAMRNSVRGNQTDGVAAAPYHIAALEHLSRAEVLLTAVSSGAVDQQLTDWSKEMLTGTRLLIDSPASDDPRIEHLLQDLELLLTQIAATTQEEKTQAELSLLQHGIKETDVLPRLRATASPNSRLKSVGT